MDSDPYNPLPTGNLSISYQTLFNTSDMLQDVGDSVTTANVIWVVQLQMQLVEMILATIFFGLYYFMINL